MHFTSSSFVIFASQSFGLPSDWPRNPLKATVLRTSFITHCYTQPRLTEAPTPFTLSTISSRRLSVTPHQTTLQHDVHYLDLQRLDLMISIIRATTTTMAILHHDHMGLPHPPKGNIMTPSRAESRVTMSNQPPPDLTHRMPPKKCLFDSARTPPVTFGTSRLCWLNPPGGCHRSLPKRFRPPKFATICSTFRRLHSSNRSAGPMARRLTTNQEIAGSIPASITL
jgi:hypothetical protein